MILQTVTRLSATLLALASAPAALAGGTIEGKVLLKGPPPAFSSLPVTTDIEACGSTEVPDPRLVVDAGGGLRWAILQVKGLSISVIRAVHSEMVHIVDYGFSVGVSRAF